MGKTTLCKLLVQELYKRSVPAVWQPFTRLPPSWDCYHDYLPWIRRTAVADRFTLSMLAYTEARGERECPLDDETFRLVEAHQTLVGAVRVLINADPEVIRQAHAARGDDMYDLETILRANLAFDDLQYKLDWADIRYRKTLSSPWPSASQPLVDHIVGLWLKRQARLSAIKQRGAQWS